MKEINDLEFNDDLISNIDSYINYIKKYGEGQIVLSQEIAQSSECEANEIAINKSLSNLSYNIRLIVDGRENKFRLGELDKKILDKLVKMTKTSSKRDYFHGLPDKKVVANNSNAINNIKKLKEIDIEELNNDLLKNTNNTISFNSTITKGYAKQFFMNTNNISMQQNFSSFSGGFEVIDNFISGSRSFDYPKYIDYEILTKMVEESINEAKEFNKAKALDIKPKQVVFLPEMFEGLLDYSYLSNLSGKAIETQNSIYEKVGETALDKNISFYENPSIEDSTHSRQFDVEGTKCQEKYVIKNGILKEPIYDYNTAIHNNMQAKGNYFGVIDFTNLSIEHKNKMKFEELEDNTLLIQDIIGAHGANPNTTEFSVNVEKAFLIKDKQKIPVTDFMISGRMIDFLNKSSAVIKNPLKYESNFTNSFVSNTNVTLRK